VSLVRRRVLVSTLLLVVGFLALLPLSQATAALSMGASVGDSSYSWHSSWSHSFTFSHGSGSWSWSRSWTGSWDTGWSRSWTSWSGTWSGSWSRTWSWRTHSYPGYVSTGYVPYCDPNNPYSPCYSPPPCNPYDPLSPCYAPPTTVSYYPPPTQTIIVTENPTQTIVVTQSSFQTVAAYQSTPQTVAVTQPQTPDFTFIEAIAAVILAAMAVGLLLMDRRTGTATPSQPRQVQSPTQVRPNWQPGLQFCTACGKQIVLNSQFCAYCGSPQQ
jgi:hypothetical protein